MAARSMFLRRGPVWLVLSALILAACGVGVEDAADTGATPKSDSRAATADPPPWPWDLAAEGVEVPASVPLEQIRSGGPPPDGIPAIDEPRFEGIAAAERWLQPQSPVLALEVAGDARAYPLAILTYHEIVNDVVAGTPLVVTYCPLCNSGLVFERTVEGEVLDFGTSGRLWKSNLVMYDRATRSLWSQFTGEAIVGERLGTRLERLPIQIVAWKQFRATWPEGQVLSRDTGYQRPYGSNPYAGYDTSTSPFLFDGETGGPLPQMERVVTTGGSEDPVAFPLSLLQDQRVVTDEIAGRAVVVWWAPGTASALDDSAIDEGRDVGTTGVFDRRVEGELAEFEPAGKDRFRDVATGSVWTALGRAVEGPLAGTQLRRVPHDDTFWFVQYAFRPDTRVAGQSS